MRVLPIAAPVLILLAACGGEVRENDDLGTLGDHGRAGPVEVLNVHVEPPADDRYVPGDDVVVRFTMVNGGDRPDELTAVNVPGADKATVHWDAECDGTAEAVRTVPLPPGTTGVDVGPPDERRHQPYYLTVTGLDDLTVAGTTLPMSFTFAQAGTVEVDAMVAIDRPRPTDYEYACSVEPSVG
ncbi:MULTISPECIES: copper chaperone PCu(A)C [Actinokineospora]|uniref:Uncharacterized protein n=1 Tax=Actinokineospora fastidiosa TaxID=1816 RepID=A0A918LC88_9PSEU|nr:MULTISPECIES: copper chaperone PCu(A)C [Actinokineospora]UVS79776.1 hypothetical protein Actkin_03526 [Actinokineospora sp. UTMC 2448]GGS30859.1 hypothetical protein GCM10010171_25680 [Actinokineospora fastidiosa]